MKSVTIELPDDTFAAARRSPLEAARDMRLALAALWYEQGVVSQGMAARIADLPRGDFMKALSRMSISPFQESLEDVRDALNDRLLGIECFTADHVGRDRSARHLRGAERRSARADDCTH